MHPAQIGLGDAHIVEREFGTWLLANSSLLAEVFDRVSQGALTSAYIALRPIPDDKPWLAREWFGRVVADPQLADQIKERFGDWAPRHDAHNHLVIFTPPRADPREVARRRFRDQLDDATPAFVEVEIEDVMSNLEGWFGEYAAPESGGWITLLSASMVGGSSRVALGNLSAFGLQRKTEADGLWTLGRTGVASVKAIGLSRTELQENWHDVAGFRLPRRDFAMYPLEGSPAPYFVALEIIASVDPKVIIGSGTVFEQLSLNKAQNLAVAEEWHHTIDAGEIVGAVLPAYCLNRHLPPPSGQAVRVTPLVFAGDLRNQDSVWDEIERRRRTRS